MLSLVPCGGCTLCCKLMTPLSLEKGDDVESYEHGDGFVIKDGKPSYIGKVLARKPNGDCHYLGDGGCTIYERRPSSCREFDCRQTFKNSDRLGRKLAVKRGEMRKDIFNRGRELLGGV